jgi:alginate O-acetyltransferase complex protein AlgI
LLLGFLVSGLVHDLVISWPAGGGYGGPTVFFLISGCGMVLERSRLGRRLGLRRGWPGWLFTVLLLVAPAPWLFHAAFIDEVVLPFMVALRAL